MVIPGLLQEMLLPRDKSRLYAVENFGIKKFTFGIQEIFCSAYRFGEYGGRTTRKAIGKMQPNPTHKLYGRPRWPSEIFDTSNVTTGNISEYLPEHSRVFQSALRSTDG